MPKAYQVTIEFQKYDKNRLTETFSDKMRSILRAHTFKTQKQTLQLSITNVNSSVHHPSVRHQLPQFLRINNSIFITIFITTYITTFTTNSPPYF